MQPSHRLHHTIHLHRQLTGSRKRQIASADNFGTGLSHFGHNLNFKSAGLSGIIPMIVGHFCQVHNLDGVQHCEVAGMQDTLESRLPSFIRRFTGSLGWKVKVRDINPEAEVHPTVAERFALQEVRQCAGVGAYRPDALRNHKKFKACYPATLDASADDKAQHIP